MRLRDAAEGRRPIAAWARRRVGRTGCERAAAALEPAVYAQASSPLFDLSCTGLNSLPRVTRVEGGGCPECCGRPFGTGKTRRGPFPGASPAPLSAICPIPDTLSAAAKFQPSCFARSGLGPIGFPLSSPSRAKMPASLKKKEAAHHQHSSSSLGLLRHPATNAIAR
jgi:hypothetical protein